MKQNRDQSRQGPAHSEKHATPTLGMHQFYSQHGTNQSYHNHQQSHQNASVIRRKALHEEDEQQDELMRKENGEADAKLRSNPSGLTINDPNDQFEAQADALADKIAGPQPSQKTIAAKSGAPADIQAKGEAMTPPAGFESRLNATRSSGSPLPDGYRNTVEQHTGKSLSDVRVHTDSTAASMASDINATAFTHGQHIYGSAKSLDHSNPASAHTLTHEVGHTMQQASGKVGRKVIQRAMKFEIETYNHVWRVKNRPSRGGNPVPINEYKPAVSQLKRKFGSSGYSESGDVDTFLSVGKHGEPAIKSGDFIKPEKGPRVMRPIKEKINLGLPAQYVVPVIVTNLDGYLKSGKPVKAGDIEYKDKQDRKKKSSKDTTPGRLEKGTFNKGTYEFKFYDKDKITPLPFIGAIPLDMVPVADDFPPAPYSYEYYQELRKGAVKKIGRITNALIDTDFENVHLNNEGKLVAGHRKVMVKGDRGEDVWKAKTTDVNNALPAQHEITYLINGAKDKSELLGKHITEVGAQLDATKTVDQSDTKKETEYNPDTYLFKYLLSDGKGATVHLNEEGVFVDGAAPLMQKFNIDKYDPNRWHDAKDIAKRDIRLPAQYQQEFTVTNTDPAKGVIADGAALEGESASDYTIKKSTDAAKDINNADTKAEDEYLAQTWEYTYVNSNGKALDVHIGQYGEFQKGHIVHLEVRRQKAQMDNKKKPQYTQEIVVKNVTLASQIIGRVVPANQLIKKARKTNTKDINPNTYEFDYVTEAGKKLDVHRDSGLRFQPGHVKYMVKATSAQAREGTSIEVQSESADNGYIEFETPKWFRKWSDLEPRIQEAVDITKAISASRELKLSNPEDKAILDQIGFAEEKDAAGTGVENAATGGFVGLKKRAVSFGRKRRGRFVEWPSQYSTSHLPLKDERLIVEIGDEHWKGKIQSSEAVEITQFNDLLKEHESTARVTGTSTALNKLLKSAYGLADQAARDTWTQSHPEYASFLEIVCYILHRAGLNYGSKAEGKSAKFRFLLMSRTSVSSMYSGILSKADQALFRSLVTNTAAWTAAGFPLDKKVFYTRPSGTNPSRKSWLISIYKPVPDYYHDREKYRKNRKADRLSPMGAGAAAMGAHDVVTDHSAKDYKLVKFEARGTNKVFDSGGVDAVGKWSSSSVRVQPAANWVAYAKELFDDSMATRGRKDTADDPSTKVNEATSTGLSVD